MDRRAAALPLLVSTVVLTDSSSSTGSSASPGETPGIRAVAAAFQQAL